MTDNKTKWLGLLRRRECLVPTWRGALVLVAALFVLAALMVRGAYPFLAVTEPLRNGALVVEGWVPDFVMEAVIAEFRSNHYDKVYVTGGPLDWGSPLFAHKSYAEGGAANLVKLGLKTNEVQAVPAPRVRQDRTYTSAVALREWCREHGVVLGQIHLVTVGAHARRSRLMFEKALGNHVNIGVTAIAAWDFNPDHWWRSSAGVRSVSDEALAYLYAKLLFRAKAQ